MEERQIDQFRRRLIQIRSELKATEDTSKEATRPVELDQSSIGRLSRTDAMQAQEMARESARRREERFVRIEAALRRIESGDYGFCCVCGEDIDPRRLTADPTHTRCVACADRQG